MEARKEEMLQKVLNVAQRQAYDLEKIVPEWLTRHLRAMDNAKFLRVEPALNDFAAGKTSYIPLIEILDGKPYRPPANLPKAQSSTGTGIETEAGRQMDRVGA